jgi:hypothetical protein
MSVSRDPQVGVKQPTPTIQETTGAGPLTTTNGSQPFQQAAAVVTPRSRVERVGFWVIVAAAAVILLAALGWLFPVAMGGLITGLWFGLFAGMLTVLNLPRPAGMGNALLGRRVFPVLRANDTEIWRLTVVNAVLAFLFGFCFAALQLILHSAFWSGLIVFGIVILAAIFYSRARTVVIK